MNPYSSARFVEYTENQNIKFISPHAHAHVHNSSIKTWPNTVYDHIRRLNVHSIQSSLRRQRQFRAHVNVRGGENDAAQTVLDVLLFGRKRRVLLEVESGGLRGEARRKAARNIGARGKRVRSRGTRKIQVSNHKVDILIDQIVNQGSEQNNMTSRMHI